MSKHVLFCPVNVQLNGHVSFQKWLSDGLIRGMLYSWSNTERQQKMELSNSRLPRKVKGKQDVLFATALREKIL